MRIGLSILLGKQAKKRLTISYGLIGALHYTVEMQRIQLQPRLQPRMHDAKAAAP